MIIQDAKYILHYYGMIKAVISRKSLVVPNGFKPTDPYLLEYITNCTLGLIHEDMLEDAGVVIFTIFDVIKVYCQGNWIGIEY